MIQNDIPVMFSFDKTVQYFKNNFLDSQLIESLDLYISSDLLEYEYSKYSVASHYMVITGIVEYSDDVCSQSAQKMEQNTRPCCKYHLVVENITLNLVIIQVSCHLSQTYLK